MPANPDFGLHEAWRQITGLDSKRIGKIAFVVFNGQRRAELHGCAGDERECDFHRHSGEKLTSLPP